MHHGIVLLFDEATEREAIRHSQEDRRLAQDPDFVLGHDRNIPHVSLLHLELDDAGVESARRYLPELRGVLSVDLMRGSFSSIRSFGPWRWWQTPFTPELLELHRRALEIMAPLRSGPLRDPPEHMTAAQSRMYEAYGCWFVQDAWNPHMTLQVTVRTSRLRGREAPWSWSSASIALARMGKFGSVQEIVARAHV